ncbi:VOC family protein [Enemella dayhoffiae]|uniref:VOC family protein n=1 Tax=Enemella dayhoffiae TaxID=2016507 RepID=UPI00226D1A02|nr:VOC family protein [Enemella dayhoffiae]
MGEFRWLTVVSPEHPEGVELVLEPDAHPAARTFKQALVADGMPYTFFTVPDVRVAYDELTAKGVRFTTEPTEMGPNTVAILDDSCGNLIQLVQLNEQP